MSEQFSDYGVWWAVGLNSIVFIVFAFGFFRPKSPRDWRSFGAFSAFLVALFTEMYGFPLTIYLFSGWLSSRFPGVDWFAHDSGHLLEMMFGWAGNPHAGPFHLLSALFVFGGFILLAWAWRVLYRAQRSQIVAMTGPYALIRHPQYVAFISIMFGFLLQWPTLPTVVMFPILVYMYVRLARSEEEEASAALGEPYKSYRDRTPGFFPRMGGARRMSAAVVVLLAGLATIAYLAMPDGSLVADADWAIGADTASQMSSDHAAGRTGAAGVFNNPMQQLNRVVVPPPRRDMIGAHFDALYRINATQHGIGLKAIEDADHGRSWGSIESRQTEGGPSWKQD